MRRISLVIFLVVLVHAGLLASLPLRLPSRADRAPTIPLTLFNVPLNPPKVPAPAMPPLAAKNAPAEQRPSPPTQKPHIPQKTVTAVAATSPLPAQTEVASPPSVAPGSALHAASNSKDEASGLVGNATVTNGSGSANAPVELPSSSAEYLQNLRPEYPLASILRREQGTVVVHVLIGPDGRAQKAEILSSSGFQRLDQSALTAVLEVRYVPKKRAGVPEAKWYSAPVSFVLPP
jgi:protein TonB